MNIVLETTKRHGNEHLDSLKNMADITWYRAAALGDGNASKGYIERQKRIPSGERPSMLSSMTSLVSYLQQEQST